MKSANGAFVNEARVYICDVYLCCITVHVHSVRDCIGVLVYEMQYVKMCVCSALYVLGNGNHRCCNVKNSPGSLLDA